MKRQELRPDGRCAQIAVIIARHSSAFVGVAASEFAV
jgi:hypothetical protein